MLSTNTRLKLQKILNKMENGEEVSLEEITFAQKLANANHSAAEMLKKTRRKCFQGEVSKDSLDGFLQDLNLGDPDPTNHLTNESNIDDVVEWFKREKPDDWRQRD